MDEKQAAPIWRSMMFVPVNVEKFVEGAHSRGADAIILDLEDSILPKDKDHARTLVAGAAPRVARSGADVLVRVNRPWRWCLRDLEAVVSRPVCAIMLPKTESPEHVHLVAEVLDELEAERALPRGHTRIVAMIETATAFFRVREIAASHPRIVAITLVSGIVLFPKLNDPARAKILGWAYPTDGTPIVLRGMAIPKGATNVNSAKLMLDYILSHDGQVGFGKGGLTPYREDVQANEVPRPTYHGIAQEVGGEDKLVRVEYDEASVKEAPAVQARWKKAFGM